MKQFEAILFDMDGTLLPMDIDVFMRGYFSELGKVLCPMGVPKEMLAPAVLSGTKAMMKNDGNATNESVFWRTFASLVPGVDTKAMSDAADSFYRGAFSAMKAFVGENPDASRAVRCAHAISNRVILATNPIFPMPAQLARASWVGLEAEDFDEITSYENYSVSKPNPAYYAEIARRFSLTPANCLMVGNDVTEDMIAAATVGFQTYLVTDCMIPGKNDWEGRKGSFSNLVDWLTSIARNSAG